jgi:hypothetical protein
MVLAFHQKLLNTSLLKEEIRDDPKDGALSMFAAMTPGATSE